MPEVKKADLSQFLPAALAVRERAAHPASHYSAATIIALLVVLFAWAYWGEIDIVARAEGKIIPLGQVRPVQSPESGIVRNILVQEGAQVEAGEVLIELSPDLLTRELERIEVELDGLRKRKTRQLQLLEFIDLNERALPMPKTDDSQLLHSFGAYQMQLLQMQRLQSERQSAKAVALQTVEKLNALEPVLEERVAALKHLADSKMGARLDYLQQREALIDLVHQRAAALLQQHQLAAEIAASESEYEAFKDETKALVLAEIEEFRLRSAAQQKQQLQLKARLTALNIRAPISGRVQDISIFSEGAVVTAAEQVLKIVPLDAHLEVEAWLENRDIGFVSPGDTSEIKLETFPFTKYGVLHGEVIALSADATATETGLIYKARIALNSRDIEVDNRIVSLIPGMGVTAEIRTGHRRVIDYIFDPMMRYKSESLRER